MTNGGETEIGMMVARVGDTTIAMKSTIAGRKRSGGGGTKMMITIVSGLDGMTAVGRSIEVGMTTGTAIAIADVEWARLLSSMPVMLRLAEVQRAIFAGRGLTLWLASDRNHYVP